MLEKREGMFILTEAADAMQKVVAELDRVHQLLERFRHLSGSDPGAKSLVGPVLASLADLWVNGRFEYEGQAGGIPMIANIVRGLPEDALESVYQTEEVEVA
jgi:hypothetical protein